MNALRHELPTAIRRLSRAPGFAFTVTGFLGVAIAALLAVAAAVYGLWLRPLPFPQAERLVEVRGWSRAMNFSLGLSAPLIAELPETYPAIVAYGPWEGRRAEDGLVAAAISPGALAALGLHPILGRSFVDDDAGSDAVLISESIWESRYAGAPDVLGRTLDYGGRPRRIVGVMPAEFRFPTGATNAWLPLVLTAAEAAPSNAQVFGGLQVVARLAPDGTAAALDAALSSRYATDERIAGIREHMKLALGALPLRDALAGSKGELVAMLAAAVAVVLLTALANLANLWLSRALSRQRELALAGALGATAARATASVFAEVLVLTLAASALGVVLAPLALTALGAGGVLDRGSSLVFAIDAPMVGLAVVLALALSLLLALPAWWLVRRIGGLEALRQGPGVLADRPALARARRGLIAVQIAAAFTLLGAGALLTRSLHALVREDAGFARDGVLLASVEPRLLHEGAYAYQRETTPAEVEAVRAFFDRVRTHPGIAASFSNAAPFSGSEAVSSFLPPGAAEGEEAAAKVRSVGPGYFDVLGIDFVAGREPAPDDAGVVVDEVFARRYLGAGEPLGQELGFSGGPGEASTRARIVGLVRTVRHGALEERDEQGTFYQVSKRPSQAGLALVLRTALPLADARAIVEREAAASGLRVARVATIDSLIWRTLRERAALLGMIGAFALFGTALAALGLYAVLAFATRRRTAEYGLKLALGADSARVAREVLRDGVAIAWPGLALGAVAAAIAVRALAPRLHGIGPADPVTWAVVVAAILAIVLVAAWAPARRAARVAPMAALRDE